MIRDVVIVLVLIICAIILIPGVTRLARTFWDWALGKTKADGDEPPLN